MHRPPSINTQALEIAVSDGKNKRDWLVREEAENSTQE